MSKVFKKINIVDPNNSEAVKEVITVYFRDLKKYGQTNHNKWLQALEDIINRFPKYIFCTLHRTNLESYLIQFLDSNIYSTVIKAAKCAHILQQVRLSQEKVHSAKINWVQQMNILCDAAQLLISTLFPNAVDIYKEIEIQPSSSTTPLSKALVNITSKSNWDKSNGVANKLILLTRLRNVFIFIQAMLVEIYPVAKPIRPQIILDVIVRALSMSSSGVTTRTLDVATIKIEALRTLDALIACLGSHLIPFSPLIFRVVMQTLKWTSENVNEDSRKIRCASYYTMIGWLTTLRTHHPCSDGRGRRWDEDLANHVLDDITPQKHVVELTMNPVPLKQLSKKAKRKLANQQLKESSISSHAPGEQNKIVTVEETKDEVSISALKCAETFITVCGVFLKPTIHKLFHERVIRECYNIEEYSMERSIGLLHVLEACRKSTPDGVAPPTQYCLALYSQLLNAHHNEVSRFCSQALLDIRMHLHCSPPSLNFVLEVRRDKKKEKKRISEKNRAVLESLLGTDKMPPIETENVSESDEPLSKKARLTDEVENISLSSESVKSISDDYEPSATKITTKVLQEKVIIIQEIDDEVSQEEDLVNQEIADEVSQEEDLVNQEIADEISQEEDLVDQEINNKVLQEEDIVIQEIYEEVSQEEELITREKGNVVDIEESTEEPIVIEEIDDDKNKDTVNDVVNDEKQNENVEIQIKDSHENQGNEKLSENGLHNAATLLEKVSNDISDDQVNIYEAKTQLPFKISHQEVEDDVQESPKSMELSYYNPNNKRDVTLIIDKLDEDNLPSTNDTDDIQISCGQIFNGSQHDEENKDSGSKGKVNGIHESTEIITESDSVEDTNDIASMKNVNKDISVDDMLADFVDEVVDDNSLKHKG